MTDASIADPNAPVRTGQLRWYDLIIAFVGGNMLGVVALVAAGIVALLVAVALGMKVAAIAPTVQALQFNFWAIHASVVISDACALFATWYVAWRRFARPFGAFFPPVSWRLIVVAALSGAALSVAINGFNELLVRGGWLAIHDLPNELALVPHTVPQFIATIAVVALFAPFFEEYFFRGIFLRWAGQWGAAIATAITAAVFALVHGHLFLHPGAQGWLYTFELFLAGVVLALWANRTGTLRTSFATHAAYNATAILFSVLLT
jgi:membrane protease YdiL (CAAX protease family)